jgi:hypothetical protein
MRVELHPLDLLLALSWGAICFMQAFTQRLNVAEAILNAVIGFLAVLGTMLLVRKVMKIVKKK